MKSFLSKILSFVILILGLLFILQWMLPAFWGNEILLSKLQHIEASQKKYDTYILGSSRVNHQINPIMLDRLAGSKSFNIGASGINAFETVDLAYHLINHPSLGKDIERMVIEFPAFQFNQGKNYNSTRGAYFYDLEALFLGAKIAISHPTSIKVKFKSILFLSKSFLRYFLKLGLFKDMFFCLSANGNPDGSQIKNRYPLNGYKPLIVGNTNPANIARRNEFLKDTSLHFKRFTDAKLYIKRQQNLDPENEFLTKALKDLISYAESKNIYIIFAMFPKTNGIIYKKNMRVFDALPVQNIANLAKPIAYKELYWTTNAYDLSHLNKVGAERLTRYLSEVLNKRKSGK